MNITFYGYPNSSASYIEVALAELELPHQAITIDIRKGEQRAPAYLAMNPNGKVPLLLVDGTPLFEGLAILLFLGQRFGVERGLWPAAGSSEELVALSWTTWGRATYGAALERLNVAQSPMVPAALHHAGQAAQALEDLHALLSILEARLDGRPYVLGEAYSLVDAGTAAIMTYGLYCGVSLDGHPRVKAWRERVAARPAFRAAFGG